MEGDYETNLPEAPVFPGYIVNITATFYCGGTYAEEGDNSLGIWVYYVDGGYYDYNYLCEDRTGWHYDYPWTPTLTDPGKKVSILSMPLKLSR